MNLKIALFIFISSVLSNAEAERQADQCIQLASDKYGIPARLIRAIATIESNHNQEAENINSDGSIDSGYLQINSWWLSKLKPYGITEEHLKKNLCTNIHVGAWILAQNFKTSGFNWKAVGAYNAGYAKNKEAARKKYIAKVQQAMMNPN